MILIHLLLLKLCQELGWEGERSHFDVLPLVIQMDGATPELFEIPKELVLEVPLRHPIYNWFRRFTSQMVCGTHYFIHAP